MKELAGPELPRDIAYVWLWYCDLDSGRGGTGFGPAPLSYSEIDAWSRLTQNDASAWEVSLIKYLDRLFLKSQAAEPTSEKPNPDSM